MNQKNLIATGLLLVLAIAGFAGWQTEDVAQPKEVVKLTEASLEDASVPEPEIVVEAPVDPEPVVVIGQAQFYNLGYTVGRDFLTFRGTVRDTATLDKLVGHEIDAYCGGKFMGSEDTDSKGVFEISGDCPEGSVWAITKYNDKEYESDHVRIIVNSKLGRQSSPGSSSLGGSSSGGSSSGGSSSGGSSSIKPAQTPVGVPEFSTTTLAAAIVTVCLGIAFVRRR